VRASTAAAIALMSTTVAGRALPNSDLFSSEVLFPNSRPTTTIRSDSVATILAAHGWNFEEDYWFNDVPWGTPDIHAHIIIPAFANQSAGMQHSAYVVKDVLDDGFYDGQQLSYLELHDCVPVYLGPDTSAGSFACDLISVLNPDSSCTAENVIVESRKTTPEWSSTVRAFPNPFNGESAITFELPRAGDVGVIVYDVLGHKFQEQKLGSLSPGRHEYPLNLEHAASGTYFVRITFESGGRTEDFCIRIQSVK
jgi:hypothetical protein